MRAIRLTCLVLTTGLIGIVTTMRAQEKPVAKQAAVGAVALPVPGKKEEAPKEEPFNQAKADVESMKSAGFGDDTAALIAFFKDHTITEADKGKILGLIKQLGDDSFDVREVASEQLAKSGTFAISLLKAAANAKDGDPEIARRAEIALKIIEKVPTRTLALAAARLLAVRKEPGISEAILSYIPYAEDEAVMEELRNTLAAVAVRDGKPDAALEAILASKEVAKRALAAEAFTRTADKASRARMKELLKKETEAEVKFVIALSLVGDDRDKTMIPELIKQMADVATEKGWKAEELLYRIAGEDAPNVSVGGDAAAKAKAREEWTKWWTANEAKVDLARLDSDSSFGLTIVCETPLRGGLGRIVALGGDAKERWKVTGINFPMDAVPLAGKRILIAEHNRNQIVEREIDGKEIWRETINQPVNVGRLPNGTTWAVGRNQIIEWERGDKANKKHVFDFVRNEYDIVAGARTKNGEYVLLTQGQQLLRIDRKGSITKTIGLDGNGVNYNASVDITPGGKALVTLMNKLTEYDLESGKAGWSANYQFATSAVRLRNGNTLVGSQNTAQIVELDKDGKPTKWSYRSSDNNFRAFRAFKR